MRATAERVQGAGLERLRVAILRRIAAAVRAAGLSEHEVACRVAGEHPDLLVVISGPALGASVMQAIRVRVLDAVREDGDTYGRVEVHFETPRLGPSTLT